MRAKRLRMKIVETKRFPAGKRSWGFGVRFGYWPCLHAPFVQLAFLFWRLDVWRGLQSYKVKS